MIGQLWDWLPVAEGVGEAEAARLRHLAAAFDMERGDWRRGSEEAIAAERDLIALGLTAYAAQALRNAGIGQLELDRVDRAQEMFTTAAYRQLQAGLAADLAFTRTEVGQGLLFDLAVLAEDATEQVARVDLVLVALFDLRHIEGALALFQASSVSEATRLVQIQPCIYCIQDGAEKRLKPTPLQHDPPLRPGNFGLKRSCDV